MAKNSENQMPSGTRATVWFLNIIVAALCLLAILCYFFGPVWKVNLTYTLTAEQFEKMIEGRALDVDVKDVIGDEGEDINLSVSLTTKHILGSFTTAESTVDQIIDSNVEDVVNQMTDTLNVLAKKVVKSATKNTVKKEVKSNVQKHLSKDGKEVTEEEVEQKLTALGFTDDYIGEKTDQLIDDVFEGGKDVDAVTANIMDTVDEVYADLQKNSIGKEGFENFNNVELSAEDKAEIENTVRDTLKEIAQEDGSIDPDELIADLLMQALDSFGNGSENGKGNGQEEENAGESDPANESERAVGGVVSLADNDVPAESGHDKLVSAVKDAINQYITDDVRSNAVYAFYAIAGLILLSMLPWAYILIKLLVKLLRRDPNPTVKLALPIWLGWLFFLILVALPTIALWVVQTPALAETLASVSFLKGIITTMETVSFSISSMSFISAICALVAFVISIYYIIVRKRMKKSKRNA